VQGPNRYGYVAGNPETATDPSGQFGLCGGMALADGGCWRAVAAIQHQGDNGTGTPTDIGHQPAGTHSGTEHQPTRTTAISIEPRIPTISRSLNLALKALRHHGPPPIPSNPPEAQGGLVFYWVFGFIPWLIGLWFQANQPWWDLAYMDFDFARAVLGRTFGNWADFVARVINDHDPCSFWLR
jgi:hypothetical protein